MCPFSVFGFPEPMQISKRCKKILKKKIKNPRHRTKMIFKKIKKWYFLERIVWNVVEKKTP